MMDAALEYLIDKLADGEPLEAEDIEALDRTADLVAVGVFAEGARRKRHGDEVTFLRVADVPPRTSVDEYVPPSAAGEVRILGTPADPGRAIRLVREVAQTCAGRPLSGFSLTDLAELARRDGLSLSHLLMELRAAGLEMIAGAPLDELTDPDHALSAAAEANIPIARATMSCGTDRLSNARMARDLQRRHGTLRAFAPLARSEAPEGPSTGYDDLKRVALARLVVDNIETIQVDWALHGPKLAQVALAFGADDVDGVSPCEEGGRRRPLEEVRRNIRAASLVPVERNGRFETIHR